MNKNYEEQVKEIEKRRRKYIDIIARAAALGLVSSSVLDIIKNGYDEALDMLMDNEVLDILMDIESADLKFNLRLDDWLKADNFNFAHDFIGIRDNIVRGAFPSSDFGHFIPRFAGRQENKEVNE